MLDLMTIPRETLRTFKSHKDFEPQSLTMGKGFRITIYEKPKLTDTYVVGADFCQGIEGADFDYAVILNKATNPVRQVAEMEGRWGPDRFDRLLYAMARYYMNAFIVGERQFGLPVLRSLMNNLHYTYIYYQRDEASRSRHRTDRLGHYKTAGDPCIPLLRMAIRDKECIVRSTVLWDQLRNFQFRAKSEKKAEEDLRDPDMKMSAPAGMYDDGVNAGAYAWKGILEVHHFSDERPKLEEGAAGATLGMRKALLTEVPKKGGSVFKGYDGR